MAKKSLYDVKSVRCSNGDTALLSYYLLREKLGLCYSFGALVEMERKGNWESAAVRSITTSPERIQDVLWLLFRNSVTPCTLHEVVLEEINKF